MDNSALLMLVCLVVRSALAQPTACQEESHCPAGFYCETYAHFCQECLRCEDLMRLPPPRDTSCVKSVVDCGLCYEGLVEDIRGDVNSPCMASDGASERDGGVSPLVWVAAALGGLFLVAVVAIVIYVLRNTDTFKVQTSTQASVQTPPEPPPPYRPAEPTAPEHLLHEEESSWPFIKPSPPYSRAEGGAGGGSAREHAAAQAARVYSNPAYVRSPLVPDSYEVESEQEELNEPFTVHDEDTMESVWSPHADAPPPPQPSAAGVVATITDSDLAPPAKRQCVPQDSNNNKGSGDAPASPLEASSSAAPSFIINVVQNIHTVQQRNDVKMN